MFCIFQLSTFLFFVQYTVLSYFYSTFYIYFITYILRNWNSAPCAAFDDVNMSYLSAKYESFVGEDIVFCFDWFFAFLRFY